MPVTPTAIIGVISPGLWRFIAMAGCEARPTEGAGRGPMVGCPRGWPGYLVGHFGVATPSFPPGDVTDRIPLLALAGTVAGLLRLRSSGYLGLTILAYIVMLGPVLGAGEFDSEKVPGWSRRG